MAVHDVEHGRDQFPRFPGDGAARFQDHFQMRVARTKSLQGLDQMLNIVALPSHQMPASKVDPLQLGEKDAKARFYGFQ